MALREALAAERPVVVHIATVKGKGFAPAEEGGLEGMERWHAAKPKSIANGAPAPARATTRFSAPAPPPYTQVFGEAIVRECERDGRIIGITAAMNSGTGLNILQKAMPERYFDVGIAEQQAVLFAAGLALQGVKPVAAIYSTFLQRAYDQIVHDVCLQKLNVVFAMDRAGLVGDDGPTHHGAFDIAYLRCLPNIVLMAPRDEAMLCTCCTRRSCTTTARLRCAIRAARARACGPGGAQPDRDRHRRGAARGRRVGPTGGRVAIVGYGTGVDKALAGRGAPRRARHPRHGRRRPLRQADRRRPDGRAGRRARPARHHRGGGAAGGLRLGRVGDAQRGRAPARVRILRVGLPDRYVTHGSPALLHEEVGYTGERIAERIETAILDRNSTAVGA